MDKINSVLSNITGLDSAFMELAQKQLDNLTKPLGSLGRLEELAKWVAAVAEKIPAKIENKVIFTFAADHGVAEEKVSTFPKEVTAQMVYNFLKGGAGINVLARHVKARVVVADLGVASDLNSAQGLVSKKINYGTKNMAVGPAMDRNEALKSIEAGIEIFEDEFIRNGVDIAGTGEMGIANTTASTAITAVFTKRDLKDITGRGTGLDDRGVENKIRVIYRALEKNSPDSNDPIDVLAKVGGFEIGGLAGVILAAASRRVPVVIDGFISGAAALIAYHLEPKVKDFMVASHCSVESGHKFILEHIGLKPILDLHLWLGEGTGAALAINIIEAAVRILGEMATFENAGVDNSH